MPNTSISASALGLGETMPGLPVIIAIAYAELPAARVCPARLTNPFDQRVLSQALEDTISNGPV